jgi:hypothetical protein
MISKGLGTHPVFVPQIIMAQLASHVNTLLCNYVTL